MEDIEYYQAFMSLIDYARHGHKTISNEEGKAICGAYWLRIIAKLQEYRSMVAIIKDGIIIVNPMYLDFFYTQCLNSIKEIDKREDDRNLDNKAKIDSIKYSKRAFWVSIIALAVSIFSALSNISCK